jgi:hypothetical protein
MMATEGIPVLYLELEIGQRLRKGVIVVGNQVSPYLGAIGISSAGVSFRRGVYWVLLAKTERKRPLTRHRCRLENNIKKDFRNGMWWYGLDRSGSG